MSQARRQPTAGRLHQITLPLALLLAALLFYLVTLAPTVLWGDDGLYQRAAWEFRFGQVGLDHRLWLHLARLFTYLPFGNVAYRINLLSAVAGAGTILFIYLTGRGLALNREAAVVAAAALAVSHTFWSQAVRAEVYTVFTLCLAGQLALWFAWRPGRLWPIALALVLLGLTLHSHQMALLLLPALALRLWQGRRWPGRSQWIGLLSLAILGLLPFFMVIRNQAAGRGFLETLLAHYTRGGEYDQALFDFSLASLGRDAGLWLAFLGLQFVGLALVLGLFGLWAVLRQARSRPAGSWLANPWLVVLLLYLTAVAFAFSYRVNDQYVFYLPSYLAATLFAGRGWQALIGDGGWLAGPTRRAIRWLLLLSLLIVPLLVYNAAPRLLNAADLNPLNVRRLPGRDPNWFFLWPGKGGYDGAAAYAQAILADLPPDAYLLADHTPLQPVLYYWAVEGQRPDLQPLPVIPGQDLAPLLEDLPPDARLFLADNNPAYYNLRSSAGVELRPYGLIYELIWSGR